MVTYEDLNILFCYNQEKLGAIKRAECLCKQTPKEIEVHTVPSNKVQDIDDDFTYVILDKTAVNTPIEQKFEQKLILTNSHRDQFQKYDIHQILVPDFRMPHTICMYNLRYPYEPTYRYIGPLVRITDIVPEEHKTRRLLILSGHSHLWNLAKYIAEKVNDKQWTIVASTEQQFETLKDINHYGHEIVYTKDIEPYLESAKYAIHYGSHQLILECIKANVVQMVIPPKQSRYYYRHASRLNELLIGTFAFDLFHRVPVDHQYQIVKSIRCNYQAYRNDLRMYLEEVKDQVSPCIQHIIYTPNLKNI